MGCDHGDSFSFDFELNGIPFGSKLKRKLSPCSYPIQYEWDMIMVTVFLSIFNQMELHLVQNRKKNCHHDHILFKLKGIGNIAFSVFREETRSTYTIYSIAAQEKIRGNFSRLVIWRDCGKCNAADALSGLHCCRRVTSAI